QAVQVAGLGTFAVVQERFYSKEEVHVVRRPVFQLDTDNFSLWEIACPTVVIPGDVKIELLDYWWLLQATSFPRHVLEGCVRETILLYYLQLRNGQHLAFAFREIGVLSCDGNGLCMQFYADCVTGLERKASRIALLQT
ncbi:CCD81 protein, partial [Centropus bengalensis]|nr:CCD81 protein [Centropus bengalensis]